MKFLSVENIQSNSTKIFFRSLYKKFEDVKELFLGEFLRVPKAFEEDSRGARKYFASLITSHEN